MKKVRSGFVLVIGLFLVAFMQSPRNVVGKYVHGHLSNPYVPTYYFKIHIKEDSTFYRTFRTNMIWHTANGYWRIDGDTLILKEVIPDNEIPKNKIDSMYFDFTRPDVWKYIIKDKNTLISLIGNRPINPDTEFFIRTTDEEYDETPTVNDWL